MKGFRFLIAVPMKIQIIGVLCWVDWQVVNQCLGGSLFVETLVTVYHSTWRSIPENLNIYLYCPEIGNFKSIGTVWLMAGLIHWLVNV